MAAAEAEIVRDTLEGFSLQLLLWVTGGGSNLAARDVRAFLRMLENSSWCRSRWARENLCRAGHIDAASWTYEALSGKKRDLELLHAGLRGIRDTMAASEVIDARHDLLRLAEATARASGGILGQAGLKRERREALLVFSALSEAVLLASDAGGTASPSNGARSGLRPVGGAARARQRVRCMHVIDETNDVKTFRFVPLNPTRFEFAPGQFTTIEVDVEGELLKRSYTIASSPSRPDTLELTVKRVPGGRVSNFLHDHLRVGEEVNVMGPSGRFSCELVPTAPRLLFISAGSGITPVMSMTRFLYDRADPRDVVFLYSARHESDLIFRDELAFMTARSRTFRAAVTLTGGAVSWRGLRGRISPALLDDAVPDFRERSVFLCGPNRFMETAREALQASGFPMSNFHAESFGGARAESVSHPGVTEEPTPARESSPPSSRLRVSQLLSILPRPRLAAPVDAEDTAACASVPVTPSVRGSVLFRTSGREANDCANQTILELAESLGLALPSACRSGVCGTCKTRKVEGSVSMDCEDGLDASDRSDGFILACTARALDRVVVEA